MFVMHTILQTRSKCEKDSNEHAVLTYVVVRTNKVDSLISSAREVSAKSKS
jgi:hypothetical protein